MKAGQKNQIAACLLLITLALSSLAFAPKSSAMSLNYYDYIWTNLSITGPDVTKPGNNETYTVSGIIASNWTGSVHVKIWTNSTSQTTETLLNQFVLSLQPWMAAAFIQSYTVFIPRDAANNQYVYVALDVGNSHITNVAVTLVQNPTYVDLQNQVSQLQAQVNSLTSSLNSVQQNYSILNSAYVTLNNLNANLTANYTNLMNSYKSLNASYNLLLSTSQSDANAFLANNTRLSQQIGNLTKQLDDLNLTNINLTYNITGLQGNITGLQDNITSLENQLTDFQNQVNSLQSKNNLLQSKLNDAMINNTSLSAQLTQLQDDNSNLQTQVSSLITNQTMFETQTTSLQSMANDLQNHTSDLQQSLLASQSQAKILQGKSNTSNMLLYAALGTTVALGALAGYLVFFKDKRFGKMKY